MNLRRNKQGKVFFTGENYTLLGNKIRREVYHYFRFKIPDTLPNPVLVCLCTDRELDLLENIERGMHRNISARLRNMGLPVTKYASSMSRLGFRIQRFCDKWAWPTI